MLYHLKQAIIYFYFTRWILSTIYNVRVKFNIWHSCKISIERYLNLYVGLYKGLRFVDNARLNKTQLLGIRCVKLVVYLH